MASCESYRRPLTTPSVGSSAGVWQMTINRTFRDSSGIQWRVVAVDRSTVSSPERDTPWLLFDSVWVQRRLSPIPMSWDTATDYRLEQMCRVAKPILGYERAASLTPLSGQTVVATAEFADQSSPAGPRVSE